MKITLLSTSVTPITQQLGTVGNESIINNEVVRTGLGGRRVPVLSGNALRHCTLREPGAKYLEETLDVEGELTRDQLSLLYHGGLKRVKSKRPSLRRIAEMQNLFPLLRLLGVCLPEAIIGGEIKVYMGMLVCRENISRIKSMIPVEWQCDLPVLAPAQTFIGRWQYVRGKLSAGQAVNSMDESDEDENTMMPFAGTCVIPNSCWLHGFYLPDYSRDTQQLLLGCILSCLHRWIDSGASIGGQSSRGHGVLSVAMHIDSDINQDECIEIYEQHVLENREECRKFLLECYVA